MQEGINLVFINAWTPSSWPRALLDFTSSPSSKLRFPFACVTAGIPPASALAASPPRWDPSAWHGSGSQLARGNQPWGPQGSPQHQSACASLPAPPDPDPDTAHGHLRLCGWAHLFQLPSAQLTSRKRGFKGELQYGSRKKALEQLRDVASVACGCKKCPPGLYPWSVQPRTSLTAVMEDAFLGEPTDLAALPHTLWGARDAGECAPALRWQVQLQSCSPWICQTHFWTSAASAARLWGGKFWQFTPCCEQRCFTVCGWSIFSKRHLGMASSGVSYQQQPAIQDEVAQSLLWFAWKNPT